VRRAGALVALALAACAGPPWFMGSPLDGHSSIPGTRKNPSWKALGAEAATARIKGQTVLELPALVALDDLERLAPAEHERLVTLLERRAVEFHALGRAVAESRDLERLARLAPARGADLRWARARAARDAGDAWLSVGATELAREAYARAGTLGAPDLDFRVRAVLGQPPPASSTRAELRAAIAALPLRGVPLFAFAYLERGGRDRATLARARAAARQEKRDGLTARLDEAARATPAEPPDAGAPDAAVTDAGEDGGAPAEDAGRPDAVLLDAPAPVPADLDAWALGGVTISARLLPVIDAHPEVLDDVPRAVAWVDLLLGEDETSPRILALAALVFGRAARFGGTERMLMELAYATPDRADGLARGAAIWDQLGRKREACAQWLGAARWRDDPEDPTWRTAIACTRRDPGAGDWREVRGYVLGRARPERRAALAASLDAP
jgi:hypothetical protein